jgi:hypothetical protein
MKPIVITWHLGLCSALVSCLVESGGAGEMRIAELVSSNQGEWESDDAVTRRMRNLWVYSLYDHVLLRFQCEKYERKYQVHCPLTLTTIQVTKLFC